MLPWGIMRTIDFRRMAMRLLVCLFAGLAAAGATARAPLSEPRIAEIAATALPAEARLTLALIQRGGPFPFRRDGSAFQNRERRLPERPYGYYREFTVPTPGARDRGARRIISGSPGEYYFTPDHYRSFRRIRE